MKIGIVTPYDSANCGAYLQAYANKCFLEKNNYNVCFIQWRNEKQRKKEYFSKPKTIKELIRCIQRYPFLCVRYKRMTQALKEFDIQKNTGDLDCTVVGSDEIWNIKVSQFQNPIFYGGVEQKSCIAYAPSAGQAALKDYNDFPWVRECLEKMTYAGVRDENTKNIVGKLVAKQVEIVCDPTMLLPINELDFPHERKIKDRYMIVYSYSVPKEHQAYLKRYARKNNLKLVSICLYQSWCDLNINCHPLEFSSYIQFSECVYTTTFHGTIFTLLNHKNCAIYSCSKKLKDLLEWTHKEETMLSLTATYDEFESLITKQHSYELFETIIEKKRKESQKIYIDALKSCVV